MNGIYRFQIVNDSQEIIEILERYLEDLIPELENWWEIWFARSSIDQIPFYFENPRVLDVINSRGSDFAHCIRIRGDFLYIINEVSLFDGLISNESIIDSIIYQLQTSYNPWGFLETENLDSLLKHKRFREALSERIPDFVYGITHTIEAPLLLRKSRRLIF